MTTHTPRTREPDLGLLLRWKRLSFGAHLVLYKTPAKRILAEAIKMSDFTNCWWEVEKRKIIKETK